MRSLRIDGTSGQLRYADLCGDASPIVYLHGLGSASSYAFPEIATHPKLREHRSILVDFLGFGYSDRPATFGYSIHDHAETAAQLLDHLGVESAVVFGHSMGGAVALLAAGLQPDRVDRLVIAEGNLDPEPGIVSGIITRWTEAEYVANGHSRFVREMRTHGFADYARTLEAASPIAVHRTAVDLIGDRDPTFRDLLVRLSIPCTFLFGDENLADPDVERLPQDGIPVVVVPDAGHDMMADNPDGLAVAIARALHG